MQQIENVLVIEDQINTTRAIKSGLKETFAELAMSPKVTYITNFEAAREIIQSGDEFQLILLDHRMPRIDVGDLEDQDFDKFCASLIDIGYTLIPEIRERMPNAKIIGTSSMKSELKNFPHKPDANIDKTKMYSPEVEFSPKLRELFGAEE